MKIIKLQRTLDPTEFMRASPNDRLNILLRSMGKQEELARLKDQHETITQDRRDLGRDIKRKKGEVDAVRPPEDTPEEEIDVSELRKKVEEAQKLGDERAELKRRADKLLEERNLAISEVERIECKIAELQEESKKCRQKAHGIDEMMVQALDTYEHMPVPDDINEILNEIVEADRLNTLWRENVRHTEMLEELGDMERRYKEYTEQLEKLVEQKAELLKPVTGIVDGLEVDEDNEVLYRHMPFALASTAEQLYVSTAIATLRNPEVKLLAIKDGSFLDDDSMAMLRKLSIDRDYQVWVEVVGDNGDVGFYIEDGMIANEPF